MERPTSKLASTPTPGPISAIDVLVQGAVLELFDAYGVSLAATPFVVRTDAPPFRDLAAAIDFTRSTVSGFPGGKLTLSMPRAVFALVKGHAARSAGHDDWARELTNQLMGRIKNRLLLCGVALQIGLPVNVDTNSEAQREHSSVLQVYTWRTLKGEVLLTLEGMPPESELSYVEDHGVALEGDAIFF